MLDKHLQSPYWALRAAFAAVPILAGLDKFTNLLADWPGYVSPLAARLLPFSPQAFMHVVGPIEVAVGVLVLLPATARLGAWLAAAWLCCIALNLVASGHHLDVAVRDLVMALGAYALARMQEVRQASAAHAPPVAASVSLAAR